MKQHIRSKRNSIYSLRNVFFLFLFILFSLPHAAQHIKIPLSPNTEISVFTIGPGNSLNDAFGHSAFRVKDKDHNIDIVYGYGQYDFDTPNFYLKFAQGKLMYLMSRNSFASFYEYYVRSNRTIKEQVLNLSLNEKQNLFNYLEQNYKA